VTSGVSSYASTGSSSVTKPVFVWLFGYTGDTFMPSAQLHLTQSQVVARAKAVSSAVGSGNLRLVSAIGEEPGMNIQSSSKAAIKNFVSQLKPYASVIYGRIDLKEFNSRTSSTLLSQVQLFESLGVNGIWLDEGPKEWAALGPSAFNSMMQGLMSKYPNLNIIMNQAVEDKGWITPAKGTTWGSHTWVSPSVHSGSCCSVDLSTIQALNEIYPGRVLLHFDADAGVNTEPMGIFATQPTSTQEHEVSSLVNSGIRASSANEYDFLFPFVGAWTSSASKYHGDLYNSLGTGNFAQKTESSFISTMKTV
jgi:hypothetical protein